MTRFAFTEFDEFVDSIRGVQGRYVPTTRSVREWHLRVIDLGNAAVMLGQGGAANIYHAASLTEWASVIVPLSRPEVIAVDGHRLSRERVIWLAPGREFQFRAFVPTRWLAINIRRDVVLARIDDGEHAFPKLLEGNRSFLAGKQSVFELVSLARRAFRVDDASPEVLHDDAARDNLCEIFIESALRCLDLSAIEDARERGRPRVDRREVLALTLGMIDVGMHKTLHLDDLCRAAHVSPRTLQSIFIDHFGMTPQRYLALRRMCAIHDAISHAEAGETVSSICQRFGVWDFGRFASQYRQYYGSLPSEDLSRRHMLRPGESDVPH